MVCKACKQKDCQKQLNFIKCEKCKVKCNSARCLQFHEENMCAKMEKCDKCHVFKNKFHILSALPHTLNICQIETS